MNLKEIHIGEQIHQKVEELQIPIERIAKFMNCKDEDIERMYQQNAIETDLLLRWSKLLKYDFFRLYTGHLILYSPPAKVGKIKNENKNPPEFRKSVYTQEVKDFIIEKIIKKQTTMKEAIDRYKIPKTTLYKWLKKS